MGRLISLLLDNTPRALLRGWAAPAVAAALAAAAATAPVLARQSLEIDGQLAAPVEQSLLELARGAGSENDGGSIAATRRQLLVLLRSEGYYGAVVRERWRENEIIYDVSPGLRFGIGDLEVETEPDQPAARALALTAAQLEPGAPLRARAVIAGEARALAALQENGWPDAVILERQVTVDHSSAQGAVTLKFQTGAFSRYGEIQVGAADWRAEFIRRLAPTPPGEPVQLSALRHYQSRLTALDGVARASVRLAEAEAPLEQRDLLVDITPSARNVLEAGFSVSTSEGGGVDGAWTRRNVFGGDESVTLNAQLSTLEQSIGGALSAPHWRKLDQTLTLLAAARNEETDAFDQQEIEAEIDVTRRLSPAWSGGVQLGLDVSRVRTNGQQEDTVTTSAGVSAVYDNRDSVIEPTRGARAVFQVSPAITVGDIQSGYVISEASLQSYRRLGGRLIAAGRVRLGGLIGAGVDSVPADARFYAGGGGSVRGFEFQSLGPATADGRPSGGRSVIEASAELRWRGEGRWGAALFADAGVASPDATPDLADMRVGVGAGLRYHFDFAPLRLDIAAPLDRRSDEASLHVYLGLGQAF